MAQVAYEALARWNYQTGILQGMYCKNFDTVTGREGDAMPVAVALAQGFPLTDILTQIEIGAVLAMEKATAARVLAESSLAAEKAAHDSTKAELAALKASVPSVI